MNSGRGVDWREIFRFLGRHYGFPAEVVWRMTLGEIQVYLEDASDTPAPPDNPVSMRQVVDTLNTRRAEQGLPPLEVKVAPGIAPRRR